MGYHTRLALLDKKVHKKIKKLSPEGLNKWYLKNIKDPDYDTIQNFHLAKEISSFGKGCEFDFLKKHRKEIFDNPKTNKLVNEDGELFIIGKDGLEAIIEHYRKEVLNYYEELQNPKDRFSPNVQDHIRRQITEWKAEYIKPYDLREDSESIVHSWNYEYVIFELVRLYKTIDTDSFEICILGW